MLIFDPDFHRLMASVLMHLSWLVCIPAACLAIGLRFTPTHSFAAKYWLSVAALASLIFLLPVAFHLANPSTPANPNRTLASIDSNQGTTNTLTPPDKSLARASAEIPDAVAPIPIDSGIVGSTVPVAKPGETLSAGDLFGSWNTVVAIGYSIGVAFFALRLLRGYWKGHRLRRQATVVTQSNMVQLIDRITMKLGMRTKPPVMWCEQTVIPTLVGLIRPTVLLPIAFANGVTIEQLEHVLVHELLHFRRRDVLANFLQNTLETIFFFHPLVWWISGQVRLHRELSCDAEVVNQGIDSLRYVVTLIEVEQKSRVARGEIQTPDLACVASVSSRSQLRTRIEQLLRRPTTDARKTNHLADGASVFLTLLLACALFAISFQTSEAAPQQEPSPSPALPNDVREHLPRDIKPLELAGIVVDANGNPLAGVTVDAWTWHPGDETTTDENGIFRFQPDSDKGRSKVEVRWTKPGYSPHYVPQQTVGVENLVISLDTTTSIMGKVTSADGTPAADIVVRGVQKDIRGDGVTIGEVSTETTTDSSGRYRLPVFPDDYEIIVTSSAGVIRTEQVQVSRGQSLPLDLQLQPAIRFEAIVKDSVSGEPFAGLVLWNFEQKQFIGISNDQGRIVIDGLLPGEFEFAVGAGEPQKFRGQTYYTHGPLGRWWSPQATKAWQQLEREEGKFQRNFDDLTFDLQSDMTPVDIFVERGVKISGRVFDPGGNPRGGATVAPAKTGSGNSLTGDTRYSAKTEDDGSYSVVMPAGNDFQYNLMAFDGEYSKWRKWGAVAREPFATKSGQKVSDYDFTLTNGATVRGKVFGHDASAPPRQVRAHPADLRGNRYYDPTVDVQPDGTFELAGLRPGKHLIQVSPFWLSAGDAEDATSVTIEVSDGEVRDGIELTAKAAPQPPAEVAPPKKQTTNVPAAGQTIPEAAGGVIFTAKDKIFSTPCFDDHSMYFGACDGNFYCLDKNSGRLRWKVENLSRVDCDPVLLDEKIFFSSFAREQNWFHAVQAKTGKMLWQKQLDGVGNMNPLIHDGQVLIVAGGDLLAMNPDTGNEIVRYKMSEDMVISGAIATRGNKLLTIVTTDYESNDNVGTGTLYCFDAYNPEATWMLPLDGCCFGKLLCDATRCYFGTRDGSFNAVDLETGKFTWKFNCSEIFTDPRYVWPGSDVLDIGDDVVLTCSHRSLNAPGAMICINKSTGKLRWSLINSLGFSYPNGLTAKTIVTTTLDHKLMQVDRDSGKVRSISKLTRPNPQWQGEYDGVVTNDGHAFIFGADNIVWRYDISKL